MCSLVTGVQTCALPIYCRRVSCEKTSQVTASPMSVSLPPLNPLRAFEAAARLGSVSSAAKELNVTHGAISHQIRKLEAALKVTLLERGARRVKLTPHGAALLPTLTTAFGERKRVASGKSVSVR